ncbi:MAG: glucokinase [Planctomycetes bacterium]|nr:glucokinase [Planctomycetota bacterium]
MILAGDIGGTKTVIGLFEDTGDELELVRDHTFKSGQHPSLEDILAQFLKEPAPRPVKVACFGVAGPVVDGQCRATNLPWRISETSLAGALGAQEVKLLNDLEAAAFGMLHLQSEEMVELNAGALPRRKGNIAVIAAGTGLGEAFLHWDGTKYHPIASEGGHADFSPSTDREIELLRYLRGKFGGHVSYERILAGPGFTNCYGFLRDTGHAPEPSWLAERLRTGDANATIAEVGLAGGDPLCVATLDLFSTIYGAEAGNLALKVMAVGGVYVGGGIAPKILPAIQKGSFMRAFLAKGRLSTLMSSIPVAVSLNARAPLIGAAAYARGMAGGDAKAARPAKPAKTETARRTKPDGARARRGGASAKG